MAERIVNFSDPTDKARVLSHIRGLDGRYLVKIARERKTRSLRQNRYCWGVVVPYVAAGLQEAWGETLTNEEVYEFLKDKFLRKPVINHTTGEEMGSTRPSGSKLDTAQFAYWIDEVTKFAAESLGVVIPQPDADLLERTGSHDATRSI